MNEESIQNRARKLLSDLCLLPIRKGVDAEVALIVAALTPQWQPIETAPADTLVVVCWLDDEDTSHPERHEFDYIEDGMWVHHANLVEHAQAVAPPGSHMPQEQAPYRWWQPLPAAPEVA